MSMHKAVDNIRWQSSQKLTLQAWSHKQLGAEREKLERTVLPLLQRYAKAYPEDAAVLEIGCGPICITRLLPQHHKTYLDPLADDYRRMFPGELPEDGEYLPTVAERIPKPDDSYEIIVCLNMIAHAQNPELVLNEAERLLKPNGTFILAIRTHSQLEARMHYWAVRLFPFLCSKTRPYYYARSGIVRTLERHFAIKEDIVRKARSIPLPFCKREQHIFVCTALDKTDSSAA